MWVKPRWSVSVASHAGEAKAIAASERKTRGAFAGDWCCPWRRGAASLVAQEGVATAMSARLISAANADSAGVLGSGLPQHIPRSICSF